MKISADKLIYTFFLLSLFLYSTNGQNKSERGQRNYFSKVKTVRTETVEFEFDDNKLKSGKRERELDSFERFDETGNLLEEINYSDGEILVGEKHKYANEQLIETLLTHSQFLHLPDKRIYKYDNAGNLIEENGYDLSGKLVNQSIYIYDNQNRKIQWTSFSYHSGENSEPHTYTYIYDEKSRLKEEKAFFGKDIELSPTDSLGRPHKRILFYQNGDKWESESYFDASGKFVKMTKLKRDSKGNEIEDAEYDQNEGLKSLIRYEYQFDKFGNWTEEKDFSCSIENGKQNCQLNEIYYRTIKYFK